MSDSSLGKILLPALLTTGAVFTAMSAPIMVFADTPVKLTQGSSQIYSGPVRNAAFPYLMLAGVASVGVGISSVAMAGWRKSAKQADQLSQKVETQQQRRAERDAHLKAALTSESYLEKSGLSFFLDDGEIAGDVPQPFVPQARKAADELSVAPVAQASASLAAPARIAAVPDTPTMKSPAPVEPALATPVVSESVRQRSASLPPLEELDMDAKLAWLDDEAAPAPIFTPAAPSIETPTESPSIEVDTKATSIEIERRPVTVPVERPEIVKRPELKITEAGPDLTPVEFPAAPPQPMSVMPSVVARENQPVASHLTAAQGFYGFARGNAAASLQGNQRDHVTIERIQSLQNQLQGIVSQIQSLQASLPVPADAIQVVEEIPSSQSGLVQQAFHSVSESGNRSTSPTPIRRVAS